MCNLWWYNRFNKGGKETILHELTWRLSKAERWRQCFEFYVGFFPEFKNFAIHLDCKICVYEKNSLNKKKLQFRRKFSTCSHFFITHLQNFNYFVIFTMLSTYTSYRRPTTRQVSSQRKRFFDCRIVSFQAHYWSETSFLYISTSIFLFWKVRRKFHVSFRAKFQKFRRVWTHDSFLRRS